MRSSRSLPLILLTHLLLGLWGESGEILARAAESGRRGGAQPAFEISRGHRGELVGARTDVLSLEINLDGGEIEQIRLLNFKEELGSSLPLLLVGSSSRYLRRISDEVLIGDRQPSRRLRFALVSPPRENCVLADGQDELRLLLSGRLGAVDCLKTFVLRRGSFVVDTRLEIFNGGDAPSCLKISGTLDMPTRPAGEGGRLISVDPRKVLHCDGLRCRRYNLGRLSRRALSTAPNRGGWIGVSQRYFVTVWMPPARIASEFFTRRTPTWLGVGFRSATVDLAPRSGTRLDSSLWVGPRREDVCSGRIPRAGDVVESGWLSFASRPVLAALRWLHRRTNNWGLSIMAITLALRVSTHPLLRRQQTSAAKLRALQPQLASIRERFALDRRRQSAELLELYRREGVNPLGGLLFLLAQVPIFLALYQVISEAVELRHAPFILWIDDLSAHDPRYVLPILTGMSIFLAQSSSASSPHDPGRRRLLFLSAAVLTGFLLRLPSGLLLHYATGNMAAAVQQWLLLRSTSQTSSRSRARR